MLLEASAFTLSYQPFVYFILVQKYCNIIIAFTKSTPEAARNEIDKRRACFSVDKQNAWTNVEKTWMLRSFWMLPWPNTHMNVTKITWKGFALSILIVYGKWDLSNEFKQMYCFIISPHGFVVQVRYVNVVICTYLKWKCFIIIYEKGTYIYSSKTFFWDLRKFFKKSLYVN